MRKNYSITESKMTSALTEDQLFEIHSLLQQTETLTNKINFPINFALSRIIWNGFVYFTSPDEATIATIIRNTLFNENPYIQFAAAIGVISSLGLTYYAHYILFKITQSSFNYCLPNGFSHFSSRTEIKDIKNKLITEDKADKSIRQLRELVSSQRKSNNRVEWASFIISFTPLLMQFFEYDPNFSTYLSAGMLGPYIGFRHARASLSSAISEISNSQQVSSYWRFIYKKYSNRNLETQLDEFKKQLNRLSCQTQQWQQVAGNIKQEKNAVIMSLAIGTAKIEFLDEKNQRREISTFRYVTALHRVLLEANLPVYISSEQRLLIGFCHLNRRKTNKIKAKLLRQLNNIHELEKNSQVNLKKLNQTIGSVIGLRNNPWQSHLEFNNNTQQYTLSYYINKNPISPFILLEFLTFLKKILPTGSVEEYTDMIIITQMPKVIHNLHANIQLLQTQYRQKFPEEKKADPEFKKSISKKSKPLPETPASTPAPTPSPYPSHIQFKSGYRFFQPIPENQPRNYAYPLRLPWLPQGRAYACVDSRVFPAMADFLSENQIIIRLETGSIHSGKEDSFGIQSKVEDYEAVDGKKYTSSLQMKFGNNTGIFAHKFQEKDPYSLYRFNGPCYRH